MHGKDEQGGYKSKSAERFTSLFAKRLATAIRQGIATTVPPKCEEVGASYIPFQPDDEPPYVDFHEENANEESAPACDDLYPVGTRIEVFWTVDKVWYAGVVKDSRVRK